MAIGLGALYKTLTNDKSGLRGSTYATDYIFQGRCYSIDERFVVSSATPLYILFDTSAAVGKKEIIYYSPELDSTGGPVDIDYLYDSDYAGGTPFRQYGRAYYNETPLVVTTYGATGTDVGKISSQGMITAGHKTSGGSKGSLEFVPTPGIKILVRMTNNDSTDVTVYASFTWFEV